MIRNFVQKRDALGLQGFSPHQKCTYGTSTNQLDEYILMAELMVLVTVSHVFSAVIECFSEAYLQSLTSQWKEKVLTIALEVIVDHWLWFWHLYFAMPGAKNDLSILDCSPLFKWNGI